MTRSAALAIAICLLGLSGLPEAARCAAAQTSGAGNQPTATSAYSPRGADTCLDCHNDPAILSLFRTKHAQPGDARGPFGHGGLQCEACHGPGGAHVKAKGRQPAGIVGFGRDAGTAITRQNSMCLGCHQDDAAHGWGTSAHAANDVACADCHKMHSAHDPARQAATQPEVCGKCHESQMMSLVKPSHHPLHEEKMACTSCHAPHGSAAPASLVRTTVNEMCTSCHAEYRGPFLWEHEPVTEDCGHCHEPHGSTQPALLKARAPLLCQQCHEAQGHPSVPMTPAGLPGGGAPSSYLLASACLNCHSQVHGSNHPSGRALMR